LEVLRRNQTGKGGYEEMRWRKVVDFPRYLISDCGKVWDTEKLRFLKEQIESQGYRMYGLYKGKSNRKLEKTHRIIAKAFIPNPLNKEQVNHKDGNKSNNDICNLEWATRSENCKHAYDTGLNVSPKGENRFNTVLKDNEIVQIKDSINYGLFQREVALLYGVSQGHVSNLLNKKRRNHNG